MPETTQTFYLLVCRECGDGDLVMPFGSAEEAVSVHDALRKSARDAHAGGRITQDDLEDRLRRIAFMERQG
jgi:hypothetical protein